jgi:hypothetical protein
MYTHTHTKFDQEQLNTFLKALGFATPRILTSSLGGLLTPTFSILREYTPKRDKYPVNRY